MIAWRSLLILPANDSVRLAKAHTRGADALVLDLEDAVARDAKDAARAGLPAQVRALAALGQTVAVRINSTWLDVHADLDAAIVPGVSAIVAPKVESGERLTVIADMVAEREAARGLPIGAIGLIALVESPSAISRLADIACAKRLIGLALGSEDFSLALGAPPTAQSLDLPCRMIALAGAAHGLMRFGLPISLAAYDDPGAYALAVSAARAMGLTGALCIHPRQVALANEGFAPSPADLTEAALIIEQWDARGDAAVISVGGRMVDLPVALRAKALLDRQKQ